MTVGFQGIWSASPFVRSRAQSPRHHLTRLQLARKSEHESQGGLSDSDVWIAAGNGEISAVRTLFSRNVNNFFQVMSAPMGHDSRRQ